MEESRHVKTNFKSKSRRATREQDSNKPTRYFSKKQEDAVAKECGGNRNLNSGATPFIKGDVTVDDVSMLLECKTKTKSSDSISVKKEWFEKNIQESLFMGKEYSAVVFSFGPGEQNYYVVDEKLFALLLEYLRMIRNK